MLEPRLNFMLIFQIGMCVHLNHLSEFIPCLQNIGSVTRAPSHYEGEGANDNDVR